MVRADRMRTAIIQAEALFDGDQRLSAGYYISADQAAQDTIDRIEGAEPLYSLCMQGGLFKGPMFRRVVTSDPRSGLPYVTATDLEQAEVRPAVYLSFLHGDLLDRLSLQKDTIVISRSGVNLGKAFYVRQDMERLAASDDLIRVVPDRDQVPAGYLFAYLDCRFGRTALRKSTHGGSVRHIEPAGIASLRVPRLSQTEEREIDELVVGASKLLSSHAQRLNEATLSIEEMSGLSNLQAAQSELEADRLGWSEIYSDEASLRPLNFDPRAEIIRERVLRGKHSLLGNLCDQNYFRGKQIFKREDASKEEGVLLLGQRAAFRLMPEGRFLSRRSVEKSRLRVPAGTVLIPSHGTLGARELYCRALVVTPGMASYAYSGDFFRCVALPEEINPGYLYAYLRSRYAFQLLRSISSGGKQQELSSQRMAVFPVPRFSTNDERVIGQAVEQASAEYDRAVRQLSSARMLVERVIGEPEAAAAHSDLGDLWAFQS